MKANALEMAIPAAFDVARRTLDTATFGMPQENLAALLSEALYRDWYCGVGTKPDALREDRDLCELLRAAHAGTRQWENGWRVVNVSSRGRIAVSRGRERRVVHLIDCLGAERRGTVLRPGDTVSVVGRRDSESMNPGDWVTFSQAWHACKMAVVRVYWNVTPVGAAWLVQSLTKAMDNDFPFLLKLPRRAFDYDRRDAAVLYLPRMRFADAADAIAGSARAPDGVLHDSVPPLTKQLALGVSVAEDPVDASESFGTSRCTLVARGIAGCVAEGHKGADDWMNAVLAAFSSAGVPVDRPWADGSQSPEYILS